MHLFPVAWAAALVLTTSAALAAEVTFPPGASVGLAPPAGMRTAQGFSGFQSSGGASIIITEMPKEAYSQVVAGFTPEAFKSKGIELKDSAEDLTLSGGATAKLMRGTQTAQGLTFQKWVMLARGPSGVALITAQVPATSGAPQPAAVEASLRTLAFRGVQSMDQQLSALPFSIADRAGMRPVRVLGGSGVYFTDGPKDVVKDGSQPVIIVASSLGGAPPVAARESFARKAFISAPGMKSLRITGVNSERIAGADWVRVSGAGYDADSGEPMVAEQAIRFGRGSYLRIVGIAREADRSTFLGRFERFSASVRPQ